MRFTKPSPWLSHFSKHCLFRFKILFFVCSLLILFFGMLVCLFMLWRMKRLERVEYMLSIVSVCAKKKIHEKDKSRMRLRNFHIARGKIESGVCFWFLFSYEKISANERESIDFLFHFSLSPAMCQSVSVGPLNLKTLSIFYPFGAPVPSNFFYFFILFNNNNNKIIIKV